MPLYLIFDMGARVDNLQAALANSILTGLQLLEREGNGVTSA